MTNFLLLLKVILVIYIRMNSVSGTNLHTQFSQYFRRPHHSFSCCNSTQHHDDSKILQSFVHNTFVFVVGIFNCSFPVESIHSLRCSHCRTIMDAEAIAKIENCSGWVSINNVALLLSLSPIIFEMWRAQLNKNGRHKQKNNDNNYPTFIGDLLHINYL